LSVTFPMFIKIFKNQSSCCLAMCYIQYSTACNYSKLTNKPRFLSLSRNTYLLLHVYGWCHAFKVPFCGLEILRTLHCKVLCLSIVRKLNEKFKGKMSLVTRKRSNSSWMSKGTEAFKSIGGHVKNISSIDIFFYPLKTKPMNKVW
jgi:hypothetical protein